MQRTVVLVHQILVLRSKPGPAALTGRLVALLRLQLKVRPMSVTCLESVVAPFRGLEIRGMFVTRLEPRVTWVAGLELPAVPRLELPQLVAEVPPGGRRPGLVLRPEPQTFLGLRLRPARGQVSGPGRAALLRRRGRNQRVGTRYPARRSPRRRGGATVVRGAAGRIPPADGTRLVSVGEFVGHKGFQSLQILVVQFYVVVPGSLNNQSINYY